MSRRIALIVLDSVRKDYFDRYFDWLPGIWFDHAWSTGNYSIPAHGSLFGGRYPSELGVHAKSPSLDCPAPVLAEKLQTAGYRTRAYSANELVGPDHGFDRGFDEFNLRWDLSGTYPHLFSWRDELTGSDGPRDYLRAVLRCITDRDAATVESLRRAYEVFSYVDDGIEEALGFIPSIDFGDNEFLFMNLMEAHWPYWGPGDYLTYDADPVDEQAETVLAGDVDLSPHEDGYEECVEYLASQYVRLHAHLTETFDYVITLADHGELFGEHGAKVHYYGLFEELTHVPIVVSDGRSGQTHRNDVVSLIDIYTTICELAGVEAESRGVNLLETEQTDPRLLEFHGFEANKRSSIIERGHRPEEVDIYDQYLAGIAMQDGYYGHETPERFIERGTPVADPQEVLNDLLERLDARQTEAETVNVSEATRQRLLDLGYL